MKGKNKKMEKKLISIVVPIYNVEKYLKKCLNSIINQTYKNLEIILVDDGSTDDSGKICDEYAKNDKRIKVIHKKNGGLSDARNAGLDICTGDYIGFVDSDDYIELNMYEELLNDCIENNCDCSISTIIMEQENGKSKIEPKIEISKIGSNIDGHRLILLSNPATVNKLYKKELFNNIRFPKGKLYEDIVTIPYIIDKCKEIYISNKAYYHYLQRNNSIVHANFNQKKMDYLTNAKEYYNFIIGKYPNLKEEANCYFILVLTAIISDIYPYRKKYKKEYKDIIEEIKQFKNIYFYNNYISKYKKIMIFLDLHKLIWIVNFIKIIRNKKIYKK